MNSYSYVGDGRDYSAPSVFQPESVLREARRQKDLPSVPVPSFGACYSHMLYCTTLTKQELFALNSEIRRVLRPVG